MKRGCQKSCTSLSNMNEHVEIIDYETKFGIFTEFNLSIVYQSLAITTTQNQS